LLRKPAVAGVFYPGTQKRLEETLDTFFSDEVRRDVLEKIKGAGRLYGLVSPHAGYIYSGQVAAYGYLAAEALTKPDVVVVLGPNHYGIGSVVAISTATWRTPLGDLQANLNLAMELPSVSAIFAVDEISHLREHSIEVQLPFLQRIYKHEFKLLPISMLLQDMRTATEVGEALAEILKGRNATLIASSDFTHYEEATIARRKDTELIGCIERLDVEGMYETIRRTRSTTCGFGPIACVMVAAKRMGATRGILLKYATSGDVTGDYLEVVGYASIAFV